MPALSDAIQQPAQPAGGLVYGHNPASNRLFSAFVLTGAAAAIAVSFIATPSPSGYGTHLRLFLPPCLFHLVTGLPCPFCGMTTAFTHMARGNVVAAFHSHVLGPAAYAVAWLAALAGLVGLIRGRWPLPEFAMSARFNKALVWVVLAGWGVNLARALWGA